MNQHEKITELIQRLGKGEPFSPVDIDDAIYWLRVLRDEKPSHALPLSIQEALNSGDGVYRP